MPDRSTPEILRLDAAPPPEPEPILTWVNRSHNGAGWTSAVTRLHDPRVGYCGRCPRERCNAELGVCQVQVQEYVTDEQARCLSTLDRPWILAPDAPPRPQDLGGGGGSLPRLGLASGDEPGELR